MNYQKITKCDTANGDGIRVTLWVSGCNHKCPGCHNPQTWDKNSGIPFTDATYAELHEALKFNWIKGLTFSGGDPFHPDNVGCVADIAECVKEEYPNKDIWCYTGYKLGALISASQYNDRVYRLLQAIDILVDDEFVLAKKDISFPYAGSSNQTVYERTNDGFWIQSKFNVRKVINAKSIS